MTNGIARALGRTITLAAVSLTIGLTSFAMANRSLENAQREHNQAIHVHRQLHDQLVHVTEDEPSLRRTADRFEELRRHGLIRPERRTDWATALTHFSEHRQTLSLDYRFEPQRMLRPLGEHSEYWLVASPMRLRMNVLHEADLLDVLDDFRRQQNAKVIVRACDIRRTSVTATSNSTGLLTDCTLDWLTVQETRAK